MKYIFACDAFCSLDRRGKCCVQCWDNDKVACYINGHVTETLPCSIHHAMNWASVNMG